MEIPFAEKSAGFWRMTRRQRGGRLKWREACESSAALRATVHGDDRFLPLVLWPPDTLARLNTEGRMTETYLLT
jgi:hypothetical protein